MTLVPLMRPAGLLDDETGLHVLTLSRLIIEDFGPESLLWDFTALRLELEERYGSIGPLTWQRISASTLLRLHEGPWVNWEMFENLTAAIAGEFPLFTYVQPPEPEEMAMAIETFRRVDDHEFSEEVKDYIVAACLHDGMWYLRDTPMEFALPALQRYDNHRGIRRDTAPVDRLLLEGLEDYGDSSPAHVQADKVQDVRVVLRRYTADLDQQLEQLPHLRKRFS